jgi:receptor protein-tyrosine kinase
LPDELTALNGSAKHRESARSNVDLATLHRNLPEIAEAFCGTMESLLATAKKGTNSKLLVLTSPEKEDGKTAVSANLAIALASTGRKVLLIDGDMRRPRLHEVFDLPTRHGLSWKLRDEESNVGEDLVSAIALATDVDGLFVLPTATVDAREIPSLLHSGRLGDLLTRVRAEFDLVLIDTPPMMLVSDARVMCAHADGALLVFRAGKTTLEIATAARQCLRDDGTRVIGTVLNDWSPRKSRVATYGNYSRA